MIFKEKEIKLKDGGTALLRSPAVSDAEEMLQYLIKAAGETPFLWPPRRNVPCPSKKKKPSCGRCAIPKPK